MDDSLNGKVAISDVEQDFGISRPTTNVVTLNYSSCETVERACVNSDTLGSNCGSNEADSDRGRRNNDRMRSPVKAHAELPLSEQNHNLLDENTKLHHSVEVLQLENDELVFQLHMKRHSSVAVGTNRTDGLSAEALLILTERANQAENSLVAVTEYLARIYEKLESNNPLVISSRNDDGTSVMDTYLMARHSLAELGYH
jgi:hypothetical protein